jgi:4-amino-4-deoxy-L-arabinose transferase-like glycosyltransferase
VFCYDDFSFLASGYLLDPGVYDQSGWVLSAYLIVKHIQTRKTNYIYVLGVVVGIGMLTKYTIAFFVLALLAGILVTTTKNIAL